MGDQFNCSEYKMKAYAKSRKVIIFFISSRRQEAVRFTSLAYILNNSKKEKGFEITVVCYCILSL